MNIILGCVFRPLCWEGVYMLGFFSYRVLMFWWVFFNWPVSMQYIVFQYFSSGGLTWNTYFH
jgi:hypothetical protein